MPLPRIAIATGDPAGIGPEIALKAALDARVRALCRPLLVGDPAVVPDVVASVLGITAQAGRSVTDCIVEALSGRRREKRGRRPRPRCRFSPVRWTPR